MLGKYTEVNTKAMTDVLSVVAIFWGQSHYSSLMYAIGKKKPIFRAIFLICNIVSKWRIGTFLLILFAYLGYPHFRRPRHSNGVFQFGLSHNNERMFSIINRLMAQNSSWKPEVNDKRIGIVRRFAWLSITQIWFAAGEVHLRKTNNPFVTVQLCLGAASVLLFGRSYGSVAPSLVIVANDHSPTCVAARAVAQEFGIAVVYIQHAPVNAFFPPLRFDLSILHDSISFGHYRKSAENFGYISDSKRVLILTPFPEMKVEQQMRSGPLRVGMCLGLLPNETSVRSLLEKVAAHKNVAEIGIRLHPRETRTQFEFLSMPKIKIAPRSQPLRQFLKEYGDLVLVPNSGVAVEALHLGHPTYFVPDSDLIAEDHYGFQAAGIIPTFDLSSLDVPERLVDPFDAKWRDAFSCFDATCSGSIRTMEEAVRGALEELLISASARPHGLCGQIRF